MRWDGNREHQITDWKRPMRRLRFGFGLLAVTVLCGASLALSADDFEAVVDDVVTAKVVSIKVKNGKVTPGRECVVLRDGKEVGRLRVKTATGVCRVLEGRAQKGDLVRPAGPKGKDPTDPKDPSATPEYQAPAPPPEGPLRTLLEAEGRLLLALHATAQLPAVERKSYQDKEQAAEKALRKIHAAERAYLGNSLAGRVALSLHDLGEPSLAAQVGLDPKAAERVLPPVYPKSAKPFRPNAYGSFSLLQTHSTGSTLKKRCNSWYNFGWCFLNWAGFSKKVSVATAKNSAGFTAPYLYIMLFLPDLVFFCSNSYSLVNTLAHTE